MANLMKQAHCWEVVASQNGTIKVEHEHSTLLHAQLEARMLWGSKRFDRVNVYVVHGNGDVALAQAYKA